MDYTIQQRKTTFSMDTLAKEILDAIPSIIFVVDEDLRILEYNTAAGRLLGLEREEILLRYSGEMLHCLHALDAQGVCGQREFCKTCVIREAVQEAFAGTSTVRRRAKMELLDQEKINDFHALITATPFTYGGMKAVLLVVEDLNELAKLATDCACLHELP